MSKELQTLAIDGITIDDLVAAKIIPANTPTAQIQIFAAFCKETGLSPVRKECYLVAQKKKDGSYEYFNITSIAGARKPAHASGAYIGKSEVMFDLKGDNTFKRMFELTGMPKTATIIIYKNVNGYKAEFPATIMVNEYVKQTGGYGAHDRMPFTMIAKTVEVHALRAAFDVLGNTYIEEELTAIKGETEAALKTVIEVKPPKEKPFLESDMEDYKGYLRAARINEGGKTKDFIIEYIKRKYQLTDDMETYFRSEIGTNSHAE